MARSATRTPGPAPSPRTRRTPPAPTALTCGDAASTGVIPEKADQAASRKKKGSRGGRPVGHHPDLHKDRNAVEHCINKIKEWRGLATRYDMTATSYLAGLHLLELST